MGDLADLILCPPAMRDLGCPLGEFDRTLLFGRRIPFRHVPCLDPAFDDAESQSFDIWVCEPRCLIRLQRPESRICELNMWHCDILVMATSLQGSRYVPTHIKPNRETRKHRK